MWFVILLMSLMSNWYHNDIIMCAYIMAITWLMVRGTDKLMPLSDQTSIDLNPSNGSVWLALWVYVATNFYILCICDVRKLRTRITHMLWLMWLYGCKWWTCVFVWRVENYLRKSYTVYMQGSSVNWCGCVCISAMQHGECVFVTCTNYLKNHTQCAVTLAQSILN